MRYFTLLFFLLISLHLHADPMPVAYKGRIRPMEAYARLWLYDVYGRQTIRSADRTAFGVTSGDPTDFIWRLFLQGHTPWDDAPVFAVPSLALKKGLGLDPKQHSYSYHQLRHAVTHNPALLEQLITDAFVTAYSDPANRGGATRIELTALSPGLWVQQQSDKLLLISSSSEAPWNGLSTPRELSLQPSANSLLDPFRLLMQQIRTWESYTPESTELLKALPAKHPEGEWVSLGVLNLRKSNFTRYPDALFEQLKTDYPNRDALVNDLAGGYAKLAGTPIKSGAVRTLYYPSVLQLKAEVAYYRYPFVIVAMCLYALAAGALILRYNRFALVALIAALILHTIVLGLRCYVLERPPVSNMFETVIYVPWIAVITALLLRPFQRTNIPLIAASIVSVALMGLLQITQLNSGLENVQAVLDSQYWLLIHVLMVVGSYGAFCLSGVLGHFYLGYRSMGGANQEWLNDTAKAMLHALYLGTALLITGTILGGVWAAQSWGRFWDWDPKESWAFISACIYVAFIHAYRFEHIRDFGLAVGSILGLMAISFTWYGVNYILGTGLHSYGFGSGGEGVYYAYLLAEMVFLGLCTITKVPAKNERVCR